MNIANSPRFQKYITEQRAKLIKNGKWAPTTSILLSHSFKIEKMPHEYAIEFHLLDQNGNLQHSWINLNSQVPHVEIIHHSNGNDYLIYHINLYGISVYNISTHISYDFYPERSFPIDQEDFKESFIWTNSFYHKESNLIVLFGCYWAAPYTGMLTDFLDPMSITDSNWIDLQLLVDPTSDELLIDDINGWEGDLLSIRVENQNTSKIQEVKYTIQALKEFLLSYKK